MNTPPAPSYLKGSALEKWHELWTILEPTRVKPALHGDVVAAYCQSYAEFSKAIEHIATAGPVIKHEEKFYDREGKVVRVEETAVENPFVPVRDTALRQMMELGKLLGLRPDSPSWPLPDPVDAAGDEEEETAMLVESDDRQSDAGNAGTTHESSGGDRTTESRAAESKAAEGALAELSQSGSLDARQD